jgi:hypothetical protein
MACSARGVDKGTRTQSGCGASSIHQLTSPKARQEGTQTKCSPPGCRPMWGCCLCCCCCCSCRPCQSLQGHSGESPRCLCSRTICCR